MQNDASILAHNCVWECNNNYPIGTDAVEYLCDFSTSLTQKSIRFWFLFPTQPTTTLSWALSTKWHLGNIQLIGLVCFFFLFWNIESKYEEKINGFEVKCVSSSLFINSLWSEAFCSNKIYYPHSRCLLWK